MKVLIVSGRPILIGKMKMKRHHFETNKELRDVGAPHAAPEAQAVAVTPPKPGPAASFLPAGPGKRGRVE